MDADQQLIQGIIEQYGAAFTMVENIIHNCDEDLWQDYKRETIISQVVYHTLFFIDFYLAKDSSERDSFIGKLGDDLMGQRTDGMELNIIFKKEELLAYMKDLRDKAYKRLNNFYWHLDVIKKRYYQFNGHN